MRKLICPISSEVVDSNVSRLTVFLNVILMVWFFNSLNLVLIGIIALDYFIRAFVGRYSPVRLVGLFIAKILRFNKKPIDLAPKIFASRLGFLCSFTTLVLLLLGYTHAALIIISILIVLSTLDSVFNFCLGCWLYSYVVLPFYSKR